jgi:hypothetical protein
MKVPNSVHEAQPWVLGQIAPDFTLLDVWALPVEGDREDFDSALRLITDFDPAANPSPVVRLLFAVRFALGRLLSWDDDSPRAIPGCTETTLVDRLPERLRGSAGDIDLRGRLRDAAGGFRPLFRTGDEWAAEISNATVHGVLQLTWVGQDQGGYRARLAVYVKPRGLLGRAYLAGIEPFRQLVVYPALMRQIARAWEGRRLSVIRGA